MRRACALVLASFVIGCAGAPRRGHAAARHVDEWGAPQISLTGYAFFEPRFILYASGRVLYPDSRFASIAGYATVALTDAERASLLADLSLDRVGHVESHERVGEDGGTECITVWAGDGMHRSCVQGAFEWRPPAFGEPPPAELTAIWNRLAHFSSPRAVAWIPDSVDVAVRPWRWWNREDRCGTPPASPWPKRWPKPYPPMPLWGWSLSFPLDELPRLRVIAAIRMARQGCAQPIELRGERYEVSFGLPLPNEEQIWKN